MAAFNWTQLVPELADKTVGKYGYSFTAIFCITGLMLILLALRARVALGPQENAHIPASKLSIRGIFEALTEFIVAISDMVIGKDGRKYVPMFATLFLVIFFNNIFGLIPGWIPATEDLNTTMAMGVCMFLFYNYVGIKEQGMHYLKHFLGPILWLGPFMLVVELISHLVRPFSLGLRLQANMMGDHTLLGVFISLVPYGVPAIFYGLGLFVSFMQAFVFTMLGMIYISMAVADDH